MSLLSFSTLKLETPESSSISKGGRSDQKDRTYRPCLSISDQLMHGTKSLRVTSRGFKVDYWLRRQQSVGERLLCVSFLTLPEPSGLRLVRCCSSDTYAYASATTSAMAGCLQGNLDYCALDRGRLLTQHLRVSQIELGSQTGGRLP